MWSVRELKRQIGSMLYERTALSTDKKKMFEMANANAERDTLALTIRDPYVFDFLGLKAREVVSEKTLEDALLRSRTYTLGIVMRNDGHRINAPSL